MKKILTIIGFLALTSCYNSARIKQIDGPGEKIITDYSGEWEVPPFKVGDTINEFEFCYGCIRLKYENKNFVVIEINKKIW